LLICCVAAGITMAQNEKPSPMTKPQTTETPAPPAANPADVNSMDSQLMNDGKRWWVVTIFWQGEDEKNPLPEKYLKH
jgi:hypothetical protein